MSQTRSSAILDVNDIKNLWRIISKNWFIIITCLGLSFACAYLYTYRLTDIYAATTQILLKSNDVYDSKSIISSGNGYNFKDYTDNYNAMRVIRSYDLIRKTIDKMKLDVSYYIHGRLRTKEVYEAVPFEVIPSSCSPLIYEQMMKFSILNTEEYSMTYVKAGNEVVAKGRFNTPIISPDFSLVVNKNPALRKNTVDELKNIEYQVQLHSRDILVMKYQRALNVEIPEYTGILQVTVEDIIPKRAVAFLDTLGKVYIENTLESKLEVNGRTLTYIEKQLQELTGMMTAIEDKLQDYKQQESILNLSKEEENYFNQMVSSQSQDKKLELQESALNALEKYIIEDQEGEFLPPTFFLSSDDIYLQNSISELYRTQTQLNSLRFSATAKGPMIEEMGTKLSRMKNDLLNYINNSKKAVIKQREAISKQIRQSEKLIGNIPFKERELLNIERNLEVNQKMYSFLLEKKAENTIAKAGIVPESKVIESARSIGVVKPNKSQITYTFIGAGILIAVVIIMIRISFYERIESLEELKSRTSIPILGEIVFSEKVQGRDNLVVESGPKSVITESFRSIRTNLQFMVPKTGSLVYLFK
ncbi:MAG: protein involved in gliding motility EpsB [Bacteroidota bacterium]